MMDKLISYYGLSRMPFGRDLAPFMLHRHSAHSEAVTRIGWCRRPPHRSDYRRGGRRQARGCAPPSPAWTIAATPSSTCPIPPSGCAASTTASWPRWVGNR